MPAEARALEDVQLWWREGTRKKFHPQAKGDRKDTCLSCPGSELRTKRLWEFINMGLPSSG